MGGQTFNLSGIGEQDSVPIGIGVGERLRVRLSSMVGSPGFFIVIVANGVTSEVPIETPHGWGTFAVIEGDSVHVRMNGMREEDSVTGIIESGT